MTDAEPERPELEKLRARVARLTAKCRIVCMQTQDVLDLLQRLEVLEAMALEAEFRAERSVAKPASRRQ